MVDVRPDGTIQKPPKGTVVGLAPNDRLLITTDGKGLPRPLRLTLDPSSKVLEMDRLVDQAYGFTGLSWRTFNRTHDPSTILYGRLLAQKIGALLPHGFDPTLANAGLGEKPWFL
jgi:hypothetical protein